MRQGQRRYTAMAWRRKLAVQESRALRHLFNNHGRVPLCVPTRWDEYT